MTRRYLDSLWRLLALAITRNDRVAVILLSQRIRHAA